MEASPSIKAPATYSCIKTILVGLIFICGIATGIFFYTETQEDVLVGASAVSSEQNNSASKPDANTPAAGGQGFPSSSTLEDQQNKEHPPQWLLDSDEQYIAKIKTLETNYRKLMHDLTGDNYKNQSSEPGFKALVEEIKIHSPIIESFLNQFLGQSIQPLTSFQKTLVQSGIEITPEPRADRQEDISTQLQKLVYYIVFVYGFDYPQPVSKEKLNQVIRDFPLIKFKKDADALESFIWNAKTSLNPLISKVLEFGISQGLHTDNNNNNNSSKAAMDKELGSNSTLEREPNYTLPIFNSSRVPRSEALVSLNIISPKELLKSLCLSVSLPSICIGSILGYYVCMYKTALEKPLLSPSKSKEKTKRKSSKASPHPSFAETPPTTTTTETLSEATEATTAPACSLLVDTTPSSSGTLCSEPIIEREKSFSPEPDARGSEGFSSDSEGSDSSRPSSQLNKEFPNELCTPEESLQNSYDQLLAKNIFLLRLHMDIAYTTEAQSNSKLNAKIKTAFKKFSEVLEKITNDKMNNHLRELCQRDFAQLMNLYEEALKPDFESSEKTLLSDSHEATIKSFKEDIYELKNQLSEKNKSLDTEKEHIKLLEHSLFELHIRRKDLEVELQEKRCKIFKVKEDGDKLLKHSNLHLQDVERLKKDLADEIIRLKARIKELEYENETLIKNMKTTPDQPNNQLSFPHHR